MQLSDGQLWLSPSDLSAYLACPHLTRSSSSRARRAKPAARPGGARRAGRREGRPARGGVPRAAAPGRPPGRRRYPTTAGSRRRRATDAAMRAGAEVIYQATFARDGWRGRADFLVRVDEPSDLGDWSYEPHDTKLARSAKPAAVLQLAWYAEEIAAIQGRLPERLHVVLGHERGRDATGRPTSTRTCASRRRGCARTSSSRPGDVPVAVRALLALRLRLGLPRSAGRTTTTSRGSPRSAATRSGSSTRVDVTTLTGLAESPPICASAGSPPAMLETLRDQAALQLHRYRTGELTRTACSSRRPARARPAAGAVARRPLLRHGGRSVLRPGRRARVPVRRALARSRTAGPTTRPFWAHDRDGEQRAFEQFVDFVGERRRAYPDMHVYHYAAYEPSTLARLMGAHATREEEIDELLRGEVLVDLLQVVRQGLRAGVESYSLKEIEKFFFTREAEVELGQRGRDRVRALARRRRRGAARRDRRLQRGGLPRDARAARLAARARDRGRARVRRRDPVPAAARARAQRTEDRRGARRDGARSATRCSRRRDERRRPLACAQLLDYHRREARPGWWWYFRRLRDDRRGARRRRRGARLPRARRRRAVDLSIGTAAKSLEWTFTFPPQQHQFDAGRQRRATRARAAPAGRSPRSTTPPARSGCGAARRCATRRCRPRSSPAARSTRRRSRRRFAASPRRCSPATAATRTSSGCCGASRRSAARSLQRSELDGAARAARSARRLVSRSSRGRPARARPTAARG